MNEPPEWLNWLAGGGIGSIGGAFLIWLFRWARRQLAMEKIDTQKDQAEVGIYQRLKNEIEELKGEIDEMKAEHAVEKEQFEQRICETNDKVELLTRKYRAVQMQALECYVLLARNCQNQCGVSEDLKQRLELMIRGERSFPIAEAK